MEKLRITTGSALSRAFWAASGETTTTLKGAWLSRGLADLGGFAVAAGCSGLRRRCAEFCVRFSPTGNWSSVFIELFTFIGIA